MGQSTHQRTRTVGWEWRAAGWAVRHPGMVGVPASVAVSATQWGVTPTACTVAAVLGAGVAWSRAHPASWDRLPGPWLRSQRRRWLSYNGLRWRRIMADCDLTRTRRGTSELLVPRVVRVRSTAPAIDTVVVRMLSGQRPAHWEERAEELAHALSAQRVAVAPRAPGMVVLTVERREVFTDTIPAPGIPATSDEVDLAALVVGRDETGQDWTIRLVGRCLLVAGTMGAGKGSLLWAPLRAMGPMIRDHLVRVRVIDLKGGMETERGRPLFADWACDVQGALRILRAFRDDMRVRQAQLKAAGERKFTVSAATPFELLMIDELAMLSAYADRLEVREAMQLLGEIQTQGRACGFAVAAYVQEPSKDIVDTRDLFTDRVCLAVTSASHVDMVLGEGARDRGAYADHIPLDENHAGIGYVVQHRSRRVLRVRAAYVTDGDIDELVAECAPTPLAQVRAINSHTDTGEVA